MQIISDRDKNGQFISSKEAWTREKIEELMNKYYPNRLKELDKSEEKK